MIKNIKLPLAVCMIAFAWNACAVEPVDAAAQASTMRIEAAGTTSTLSGKDAWGVAPVETSRLAGLRGGSSLSANVVQTGTVQGNTTSNVSAGANSVSGGSFANASGLPLVIQNSGTNVVIQNSTVVNILFKP